MKLKSFNNLIGLLIISFYFYSSVLGEEKIDIWKNKNKNETIKNLPQI